MSHPVSARFRLPLRLRRARPSVCRAAWVLLALAAVAPPARADSCDLGGTWAVRYAVPLSWRMNLGIEGGTGEVVWTVLVDRSPEGEGAWRDAAYLCSRQMPATRSHAIYGHERYASRLDTDWLDAGRAQSTAGHLVVQDAAAPGATTFASAPWTVWYGLREETALADGFPSRLPDAQAAAVTLADDRPGFRMAVVRGEDLALPPVNARRNARALAFHVVGRDVLVARGTLHGCDRLTGEVQVEVRAGRAALQTAVVGCALEGGKECTRGDLGLINNYQPTFRPGPGSVQMVRLPAGASCHDVRALWP